jgi:hypothetical protein
MSIDKAGVLALVDKHISKKREIIGKCDNWSVRQGEESRARDALLDLRDDIEANL